MRALKIVLIICCILIILIGGTLTAILVLVDPNDYKDDLAAAVKQYTGRELTINDPLSLSVFPWLGLEMGQVRLGNAPGFSSNAFAGIDKAELRIKILPLLRKELRIGTIVLDGFQLNLETNAQGGTNWSDWSGSQDAAPTAKAAPQQPPAPPSDANKQGAALAALAIDGIKITNGQIIIKDRQQQSSIALTNVEMTADHIAFGSPFAFFFGFDAKLSDPDIAARITLKGNPLIDLASGTYAFSSANLHLAGTGAALPGGKVDLDLTTDITADLHKETLTISNILLTTYDLNLSGEVQGQTILSQPTFTGELHLAAFSPKKLMQTMGLSPVETADPHALTKAQTDLSFTVAPDQAALTSLRLLLDTTTVTGTAHVNHFAKPAIAFGIDVDAINADRYLPPKKEQPAPANQEAAAKDTQQAPVPIPLPIEALRNLDIQGKLTVKALTVNRLKLSDLLFKLTAKQGKISLAPISAALYDGTFGGTAVLNVQGKIPRIQVTEKLTAMQVGPLLNDMTGKDTLTGTTRSTASLTTAGMTVEDFKANLNGNLAFDFANGAIKGINLPKMLRDAVTKIKGGKPDPNAVNQTDFAALKGSATITKGILKNRDLLMMSPLMRVKGAGTVDLPQEGLNYLLKTTIVSSLKGQKGEPLSDLAGLTVPVRITGTFAKPGFKLDLASLLREKGLQELKTKAGQKLFKGKSSGGFNPGKTLKGLFQ